MFALCRDKQAVPGNPLAVLRPSNSCHHEPEERKQPPDARARQGSLPRLPSLRMATQGGSCPLRTRSTKSSSVWPILSFTFIPVEILAAKVPDCSCIWVYRVWSAVTILSLGLVNKRLLNMVSEKQVLNLWMSSTFLIKATPFLSGHGQKSWDLSWGDLLAGRIFIFVVEYIISATLLCWDALLGL